MAKALQILGILCLLTVLVAWFALGANKGWTRTKLEVKHLDPVTEIPYTEYQDAFLPGVELLAAGVFGSVFLFAAGYALSKFKPRKKTS